MDKGLAFNLTHNNGKMCPTCHTVRVEGLPMSPQVADMAEQLLLDSIADKRDVVGVMFNPDGSVQITISAEKEKPTRRSWWDRFGEILARM